MDVAKGFDFTLKYYGLFGALVVLVVMFLGWYIRFITGYFVNQIKTRDKQIDDISTRFTAAVEKLALAIDREARNQVEMAHTYKDMLSKFELFSTQTEAQYKTLLEKNRHILEEVMILKKINVA